MQSAASVVGIHLRTLQQWLAWYRQGGLSEVLAHRHGGHAGRCSPLSASEQAQLKTLAATGQIGSLWDGDAWAQEHCGVTYNCWGMRSVFARLGLKKKFLVLVPPRHPIKHNKPEKRGANGLLAGGGLSR